MYSQLFVLLNQYFQKKEPWKNPKQSATSLFVSINAVRSLSILLEPFIPFSAEKIWQQISLEGNVHEQKWNAIGEITLKAGHVLGNIQPLFKKIDEVKIKEQANKLNNR